MKTLRTNLAGAWLLLLLLPSQVHATRVVGGNLGLGYLPMTDWQDFLEPSEYSHYDDDAVGLYAEIYAKVTIHSRGALGFSLERISKSASNKSTFPGGIVTDLDFRSIPISLTYELNFRGSAARSTPFVGVGGGAYYSLVKTTTYNFPSIPSPVIRGERDGWGYGLHAYVGQRAAVSRSLALSGKVRGRWADGMYFSDDKDDIDVDFTGVDITVGIEYAF